MASYNAGNSNAGGCDPDVIVIDEDDEVATRQADSVDVIDLVGEPSMEAFVDLVTPTTSASPQTAALGAMASDADSLHAPWRRQVQLKAEPSQLASEGVLGPALGACRSPSTLHALPAGAPLRHPNAAATSPQRSPQPAQPDAAHPAPVSPRVEASAGAADASQQPQLPQQAPQLVSRPASPRALSLPSPQTSGSSQTAGGMGNAAAVGTGITSMLCQADLAAEPKLLEPASPTPEPAAQPHAKAAAGEVDAQGPGWVPGRQLGASPADGLAPAAQQEQQQEEQQQQRREQHPAPAAAGLGCAAPTGGGILEGASLEALARGSPAAAGQALGAVPPADGDGTAGAISHPQSMQASHGPAVLAAPPAGPSHAAPPPTAEPSAACLSPLHASAVPALLSSPARPSASAAAAQQLLSAYRKAAHALLPAAPAGASVTAVTVPVQTPVQARTPVAAERPTRGSEAEGACQPPDAPAGQGAAQSEVPQQLPYALDGSTAERGGTSEEGASAAEDTGMAAGGKAAAAGQEAAAGEQLAGRRQGAVQDKRQVRQVSDLEAPVPAACQAQSPGSAESPATAAPASPMSLLLQRRLSGTGLPAAGPCPVPRPAAQDQASAGGAPAREEACALASPKAEVAAVVADLVSAVAVEGGSRAGPPGPAAWDPNQPSTSAAATAAAATAASAPPLAMPDPSNPDAMLQYLRSLIPTEIRQQYGGQQVVGPAEKAAAEERLGLYHAEVERITAANEVKLKQDMRALRNLKAGYPSWPVWQLSHGHPPGIEVGREFVGRGELTCAGVTANYMRGISRKEGEPAFAVCCSGGYEDDTDHGNWLIYTGEGGRNKELVQVEDQEWEKGGNLALRQAWLQHTPVRVARGSKEDRLVYTYDGLYCIVKAEREPGKNGLMVCRYWMVGIPGHYNTAARQVSFLALRGIKNVQLAAQRAPSAAVAVASAPIAGPRKQKQAAANAAGTKRDAEGKPKGRPRKQWGMPPQLPAAPPVRPPHELPGLLLDDISSGLEAAKIPVFNQVDDDPAPTNFTYVRTSIVQDSVTQQLVESGLAVMPGRGQWCGLQRHRELGHVGVGYNEEGQMLNTEWRGIWECCSGCTSPACQLHKVVTAGAKPPLEVFRTRSKGWGVRSSGRTLVGTVVCTYEGEITTHTEVERRKADTYFMDMDHFLRVFSHPSTRPADRARLPPIPQGLDPVEGEHLVIDACKYGSVARFINHSCTPNLLLQPVLTEGSSPVKYTVAIVAARDIEPLEEMCYDYHYAVGSVPDTVIQCNCGTKKCRGRLL